METREVDQQMTGRGRRRFGWATSRYLLGMEKSLSPITAAAVTRGLRRLPVTCSG